MSGSSPHCGIVFGIAHWASINTDARCFIAMYVFCIFVSIVRAVLSAIVVIGDMLRLFVISRLVVYVKRCKQNNVTEVSRQMNAGMLRTQ